MRSARGWSPRADMYPREDLWRSCGMIDSPPPPLAPPPGTAGGAMLRRGASAVCRHTSGKILQASPSSSTRAQPGNGVCMPAQGQPSFTIRASVALRDFTAISGSRS